MLDVVLYDLKTTIMGVCVWVGGWLRIKLIIRLYQLSLAGAGWLGLSLAKPITMMFASLIQCWALEVMK